MAYQVLARKWRPHNFKEIVGQEHVVKSLINALQFERMHHAYLFTGTRGVGKTTIARILAKAINCENLNDFNPCGQCEVCQDLDAGRFLDLIEVDAASRTKVEDTRDLLDNAQYAPSRGRYKVYLIDEVHMLSGHSFNALLKTLEEPPPHVKFLLATTDPQKIPVTVLSRCLQFNLKRLSVSQISGQMQYILAEEKIVAEESALQLLARAADGSMRDGLSLLDQAIVFGNGAVKTESMLAMLGTVAQQPVNDLLNALAKADAAGMMAIIDELSQLTTDFANVLEQMLQALHRVALYQFVPDSLTDDMDTALITTLGQTMPVEEVQLYYQIALVGQKDLDLAPDPRSGFEMLMLRMLSFKPADYQLAAQTAPVAQRTMPATVEQKAAPVKEASSFVETTNTEAPVITQTQAVTEQQIPAATGDWAEMVQAMRVGGITRELANNCVLHSLSENECVLLLDSQHKQLSSPKTEEKLKLALQKYFGKPIRLTIKSEQAALDTPAVQINKAREDRQQAAVDAINSDENIQALKDQFGARILPGTIEPID